MTVGELVSKLKLDITDFEQGMAKAGQAADKGAKSISGKISKMGDSMMKVGKGMSKFITLPILGLAAASIKSAAAFEKQQVALETLLGSAEDAAILLEDLENFAASTPFQLPDLISGTTRLLAFGSAAEDILDQLEMLGNVAMGDTNQLNRLVDAFGKVQARGKASMRELNMFLFAGVPIMKELSEMYEVTQEQLFKMVEQGKVTFEGIDQALQNMTASGGQFHGLIEKQSKTLIGLWSTMKDNLGLLAKDFGDLFLPALKEFVASIIRLLQNFRAMDTGTKQIIARFALLLAAIGPAALAIGKLIKIVLALKVAFAALSANPIMVAVAAVGALAMIMSVLTQRTDNQNAARKDAVRLQDKLNSEINEYKSNIDELLESMSEMQTREKIIAVQREIEDKKGKLRRDDIRMGFAERDKLHQDLAILLKEEAKLTANLAAELVKAAGGFQAESDEIEAIKKHTENYDKELKKLTASYDLFGNYADYANEQQTLLKATLQAMIADGLEPYTMEVQELLKAYTELAEAEQKIKDRAEEMKEIEEDHAERMDAELERVKAKITLDQEAFEGRMENMMEEKAVTDELREELREGLMTDSELELEAIEARRIAYETAQLDQNKIDKWYKTEKEKLVEAQEKKVRDEWQKSFDHAMQVTNASIKMTTTATDFIGQLWEDETQRKIAAGNLSEREEKKLLRDEMQRQKSVGIFKAVIATALAIITALTHADPIIGAIMAVIAGVTGAIQVAAIMAEPLPAFAKGGLNIKKYAGGGVFEGAPGIDTNLARLTSGEFVVNKDATAENLDTLEGINSGGGAGGITINPMPLLIEMEGQPIAEYTIEFMAEESDRGNVRLNPKAIRERA